jgi:hypothetical protein
MRLFRFFAPPGTKSLALIADDPDAPAGTWTPWVVFTQGALMPGLPEGVQPEDARIGGIQGTPSFGKTGYGGPIRHGYHIIPGISSSGGVMSAVRQFLDTLQLLQ